MYISAVIPTFNRADSLERALCSVIEQTEAVDEIIVVDDGSTDDSACRMAARFPQIRLRRQPRLGVSAARNRGVAVAQSEWIALLDSDDCWHPNKIARIRQAHREHPDYRLYHSDEIWIRHGVRVNPMRKHRKHGGWIFHQCLPLCAISPSTAVIHKSTFNTLGGFDESLPACEDYDLWLRLCQRFPVHLIDEKLVTRFAGHEDQLSKRYPLMDRFRIRSLDHLLRQAELSSSDHEAALDMLLQKLNILISGAIKHHNQAVLKEFSPLYEYWSKLSDQAASC